MNDYVALLVGVASAGAGGELFVRGTVGLAHWMRISPGLIAATVAAFATSSPELAVSITAALAGTPQLGLGDALGSNIVNVAFILGLTMVISGGRYSREGVRREFPVAVAVPVLTGLVLVDGILSRLDSAILLGMFFAWLAAVVREARRQRRLGAAAAAAREHGWRPVIACLGGLILLGGAGRCIVTGATGIAGALGFDDFAIGAVIVALGTSVPEIAATVVAGLRGHHDVGLGTILGSNIFNGLFIVPVAALICPIAVGWRETVVALGFGLVVVILALPTRDGRVGRGRGAMLLGVYAAYLVALLR